MISRRFIGVIAIAIPALAACGHGERVTRDSVVGQCTISDPTIPSSVGVAAFVEHVTPTAGGGFGVGSRAITLTCLTSGPDPDQLLLVLPNLQRGRPTATGEYKVRAATIGAPSAAEMTDGRLAWARLRRGDQRPLLYEGVGGRIAITRASDGTLEGAFEVALATADSSLALPGARPEVTGPLARDTIGQRVIHRTVVRGAFVAPLKEADWRGR
jgi:hypothetical protein